MGKLQQTSGFVNCCWVLPSAYLIGPGTDLILLCVHEKVQPSEKVTKSYSMMTMMMTMMMMMKINVTRSTPGPSLSFVCRVNVPRFLCYLCFLHNVFQFFQTNICVLNKYLRFYTICHVFLHRYLCFLHKYLSFFTQTFVFFYTNIRLFLHKHLCSFTQIFVFFFQFFTQLFVFLFTNKS